MDRYEWIKFRIWFYLKISCYIIVIFIYLIRIVTLYHLIIHIDKIGM
jgi:hypothetical protein